MNIFTRKTEYEWIGGTTHQILLNGRQDEVATKIYGYKYNTKRTFIFHILCVLFAFIPYIIFCWYPQYKMIKYKKCSLSIADLIFLIDTRGHCEIIYIQTASTVVPNYRQMNIRYFYYQHTKYVYHCDEGNFVPLDVFISFNSLDDILETSDGVRHDAQQNLLDLYGPNKIEIEVKSYWRLFVEEVFNPFYIFQVFSMALWCVDDYLIYAGCVLILTAFSICTSLYQTRKQSQDLHDLVESSNTETAHVLRPNILAGHTEYTVHPADLVPGDLLIIPATGCIMPCDAVLITGNCIVNESMLTGESVPVTKTPPHSSLEIYNPIVHKRHTLFSGTHILQTRYYGGEYVLACVVRTGFDTTKGALVKSILFPSPVGLKFYSDSLKFVMVLFFIAISGMGYCIYLYVKRHADIKDVIIRTLDIITIVVPPALPAAMTVGTVYSQSRLKKLGIFCISPLRINVGGKVKLACFDKTGTLTHEGLEMYSVIPSIKAQFIQPVINLLDLDVKNYLVQGMATCHSLTRIDGTLTGDPLDMIMFNSTHWDLEEAGSKENTRYDLLVPTVVKPSMKQFQSDNGAAGDFELPYEIGIIRQFPFSSNVQCMSVICCILGDPSMIVFTKGAPEKLRGLCKSETLPHDFNHRLTEITAQGFRVIALAYKKLQAKFKWKDAQKVKREIIECDLNFLGLVILQNTLKPETTPVMSALHNANIRTVMITGDNIRTAISVARDCGMVNVHEEVVIIDTKQESPNQIPSIMLERLGSESVNGESVINVNDSHFHFAMDGKTWTCLREYYPDMIPKLLVRCTVFARFQPDQKTQLIAQFQKIDYVVSMVGDGANDCGALKAAHVGVSLSQEEASVAAPFTSSIQDISCILYLILEGRCALVTSFAVFKYMALYSLIQFFSVLILYTDHSIMGDMQFLFIDLVITTVLAVTIGRQGPCTRLVPKRPMGSLVCANNLIPLILQILLCASMQFGALYYLKMQSWYEPLPPGKEEVVVCWANTVTFCVSSFQYLILALVFSKGKPYRESLIYNFWLLLSSLTLTCFITWLLVYPSKGLADFFEILYLIHHTYKQKLFRYELLLFPIIHFVLAVFVETCIAESGWLKKIVHFVTWKKKPRNKYKLLLRETNFSELFQLT